MNDYVKVRFQIVPCPSSEIDPEVLTDILAAQLANYGFESFEANGNEINAYISSNLYSKSDIDEALAAYPITGCTPIVIETEEIEGKDWNEEWEKNYFKPVVIGKNLCVIHSTFHKDYPKCEYEIIIDPRMAFGTGNHATTALMLHSLLETDVKGKRVIDMGTGSGILAIMAAKLGASEVYAVEIDPYAHENAIENAELNGCKEKIKFFEGDASQLSGISQKADIFLANINRNVILEDIEYYAGSLNIGGELLLSGFYNIDSQMIIARAKHFNFVLRTSISEKNWNCLKLKLFDSYPDEPC